MKTSLRIIFTLLFSTCFFYAYSQAPTASWLLGEQGSSGFSSILQGDGGMKTDSFGNSYVYGEFGNGTVRFGNDSLFNPTANRWLFICKINAAGKPVWIKQITANTNLSARNISVNALGNFVVSGDFGAGTVNFTPTDSINRSAVFVFFIAGYDSSGKFLWANSPTASPGQNQATGVFIAETNYIFCTGMFNGSMTIDGNTFTSQYNSVFTAKFSPTGSLMWVKSANTLGSFQYPLSGCEVRVYLGIVYVSGYFTNNLQFTTSDSINGDNSQKIFLAKYDSSGNFYWAKNLGGSPGADDFVYGMGIDDAFNVYVAGTYQTTPAAFGADTLPVSGSQNGFLLKCDSTGKILWADYAVSGGSTQINDLAVGKSSGNCFITGGFDSDSLVIGNSNNQVFSKTPTLGNGDGFLAAISSGGQGLWVKTFATPSIEDGEQVDIKNNILTVGGTYYDSLHVDGFNIGVNNINQIFVCQFNSAAAGINEVVNKSDIKIFPVPAGDKIFIQSPLGAYNTAQVIDLTGRILFQQPMNSNLTQVEINKLSAGMYIIRLKNNNAGVTSGLFVKQ